ncbi:hypothetical protein OSB04_018127 [Centaurea solstitialis]|uniref:Zinc finger, CCHC-type n=1 Tax=Centaurea solstitialis TaxID=347529 RepID=A0AA38TM95_9ASTR|nr:hypothetical protein OSB04_018127 [Centaurea solstitialis]
MVELSSKDMTTKFNKLEKFRGIDFKRWQEKEDETPDDIRKRCKWDNDDYICRGHILNGMSDPLFDLYQNMENAKQLWNDLESKYIVEDASSKKFLVSDFNNYKMVDSRPVMKEFKHILKYPEEEFSLVKLGSHVWIEKSFRDQESDKEKVKSDVDKTDQLQVDEAKSLMTSKFVMTDLGEVDVILVSQLEYSQAIGCLMYAMTSTCPDIAYAIGRLSRGGAISWASKKQTCITNSTMESEFVALAAVGKEAEWLRNLIYEIPLWSKPIAPFSIHCDSAATLAKAYSQVYNGKSRHLGVRHNMIRDLIMNGVISVEFVKSQQNLADHLTKSLVRDLVHKSVIGMGLRYMRKGITYMVVKYSRTSKSWDFAFYTITNGFGHSAL